MSILELLGLRSEPPADAGAEATETVRKIARELDHLEPDRARFLAAFAYLLSRVARADLEISDQETRAMERIVVQHGGLPEEQAVLVVQMAKTQSLLFGGTENFLVTKEFARLAGREHRLALLRCLFEVGAAEAGVSTAESNVIRQIADELGLDHADYAAVRTAFRAHLAVLRPDTPDEGS